MTPREREVLDLARRGYTNNEIAEALGITRNAVRYHLKEVHSKLGTGRERSVLARARSRALSAITSPAAKVGIPATVAGFAGGMAVLAVVALQSLSREGPHATDGPTLAETPVSQYIVSVSPLDGSLLSHAATRRDDTTAPDGLCARVSFAGAPETGQWFRMFVDGEDVTSGATWVIPSATTTGGRLCYASEAGLAAGSHRAEVNVRDPVGGPVLEQAVWRFTVVP